nr:hypothetical protein [Tanacetum cinerariifolium]
HVARQSKESKRARDSLWYHDKALLMQAKEKGDVLDVEAEAFLADVECTAPCDQPLALTTTNLDDLFFSDVSYPLAQEMQQEEHLNSEFDWVLDDNMFTYDEYQNDFGVETVPTVVSADEADKQSMIAILQHLHTEIAGYVKVNDEHKLVNATLTAELERCKIEMQAFERNKFVPQKELSREQVYWLPAAKIASQSSTPAKPVAPFVHTRPVKSNVHKKVWKIKECITAFEKIIKERTAPPPSILSKVKEFERIFDKLDAEYEWILLEKKNMQIEKKNLLITNECLIANSIANDICSIVLAYDLVVPPSSDSSHCMLEELRTTYDRGTLQSP